MINILIPLLCVVATPQSHAPVTVKVIKIVDGDTVDVLTSRKETIRLRLNGIDAPETGQPYGKNAKQWLANAVGNRFVSMTITDKDRYGRSIADIRYGARSINERMVREGLAWHYV